MAKDPSQPRSPFDYSGESQFGVELDQNRQRSVESSLRASPLRAWSVSKPNTDESFNSRNLREIGPKRMRRTFGRS